MEALRQSARSMYAYVCFDLECLYRELTIADIPHRESRQVLSARAEELIDEISRNLRNEVLAAENPDAEIIAVADGFAKSMGCLCRSLLNPIISDWYPL